jgi:hypothetical protein
MQERQVETADRLISEHIDKLRQRNAEQCDEARKMLG